MHIHLKTDRTPPIGKAGFTLIELMVTVSVAAILLAIGVPSFNGFVLNQRVKNASFDIYSMLTYARSEAIKRNNNVTVTAANGGWQNGWSIASGGAVIGQNAGFSNLSVTNASSSITYGNSGHITAAAAMTFEISGGGNTRCITVDLSGMPRSKSGSC